MFCKGFACLGQSYSRHTKSPHPSGVGLDAGSTGLEPEVVVSLGLARSLRRATGTPGVPGFVRACLLGTVSVGLVR